MTSTPPKKRKLNPMLMNVLIISLVVHLVAGFILAGITIVSIIIPEKAQFEDPPAVEEVELREEVEIVIKPTSRPIQSNLQMRPVANIAVAAVDINLPEMDQSFTVSSGIGNFSGGNLFGGASGRIGLGVSNVNVFGIKAKAERILFVIDSSRGMVVDEKGGLNSYNVIKEEITDMVGNLSAGTLFNVMLYENGGQTKFFKKKLVPAGGEIQQALQKWFEPINSSVANVGLRGKGAHKKSLRAFNDNQIQGALMKYSWNAGGLSAYIAQLTLEQSIDAAFIITGYHRGFEQLICDPTEKEHEKWLKYENSKEYKEKLKLFKQEEVSMRPRVVAALAGLNAKRKAKGLPPRVLSSEAGNVSSNASELGIKWVNRHPGYEPKNYIEPRQVERYFKDLINRLYTDKGGKNPSVNVVLFLAGDEKFSKQQESSLKRFVKSLDGKHRVIRGEDEIKGARSAKDMKN